MVCQVPFAVRGDLVVQVEVLDDGGQGGHCDFLVEFGCWQDGEQAFPSGDRPDIRRARVVTESGNNLWTSLSTESRLNMPVVGHVSPRPLSCTTMKLRTGRHGRHDDTASLDHPGELLGVMLVLGLWLLLRLLTIPLRLSRFARPLAPCFGRLDEEAFFDAHLDDQALRWTDQPEPPPSRGGRLLTSVLLNISSSKNSLMPRLRALASAKATPTFLLPFSMEILMAMTMGDDRLSVLENSRSSTCCRFPGDACQTQIVSQAPRLGDGPPYLLA